MSSEEDPTTVPIVCPECDTHTRVPLEEVADAVSRHNESVHDGEAVAEVDPEIRAELADLIADDLDLV